MTGEELLSRFTELEYKLSNLKAVVQNDYDRLTADGHITIHDRIKASTKFHLLALLFREKFEELKNDTCKKLIMAPKPAKHKS